MSEDTFYDIHMHAFNLSHPYYRAFIKRFRVDLLLVIAGFISIPAFIPGIRRIILFFVNRMLRKIRNLLSVMENDIGSFFLLTENCVREKQNPLLTDRGLHIGDKTYRRVVLTPLMMDFGRKGIEEDKEIHYSRPSEKPIVEQVTDVFNAIRKYRNAVSSPDLLEKYPFLGADTTRVFEIYPFLGLNPKNYDRPRIERMLEKYFGEYAGSRQSLLNNMGRFDGDIEHIGSGFFAGIKLYPPLGFDPWPSDEAEMEKVRCLYAYCCEKGIPITAHGSTGGFVAVERKELKQCTKMSKWAEVLRHHPELKFNLAHFPMREKWFVFPDPRHRRLKATLRLALEHQNFYVDFSNRAANDKYYQSLRRTIDSLPGEQKTKLTSRILFGSDYTVNLMAGSIDSYNKYLDLFSKTRYLTRDEKHQFCCTNPERFLFSGA